MLEQPTKPVDNDQSPYSEQLDADIARQQNQARLKFYATKIRDVHPELKDINASDEEALYAFHRAESPDATPEEYAYGLTKLFGEPDKKDLPQANIGQTAIASGGNMLVSIFNDLMAAPRGVVNLGQAEMAREGITGFNGATPEIGQPNPDKAAELEAQAKEHFKRGGAFAAGLVAAAATAEIVNPLTAKFASAAAKPILRLATGAARGAADWGMFGGTSAAAKQLMEHEQNSKVIMDAFLKGFGESAPVGALAGAGGVAFSSLKGSIEAKAYKAGKATANAKTLGQAKSAMLQSSKILTGNLCPLDRDPKEWITQQFTEAHGADAVNSPAGQQAIANFVKSAEEYRRTLTKAVFLTDYTPPLETAKPATVTDLGDELAARFKAFREGSAPAEATTTMPGTGLEAGESPAAAAAKVQVTSPDGLPVWNVAIEVRPGTVEVHSLQAPSMEEAKTFAEMKAKQIGGEVRGDITPEYRMNDRRVATVPVVEERRVEPRRGNDRAELENISKEAMADLKTLNSTKGKDLVSMFNRLYPGLSDTQTMTPAQMREFMRREITARIKGASQSMPGQPTVKQAADTMLKAYETKLPKELTGAKPRYGYGSKLYELKFESDVDRALYIVNQTKKSKADAAYRKFLTDLGFTDDQMTEVGQAIKRYIKEQAKVGDPEKGPIEIPPSLKADMALDPELLKKISKAMQEGTLKNDPTIAKKLAESSAPTDAGKSIAEKELAAQDRRAITNALKMGDWKLVDMATYRDPQLLRDIASTPEYHPLLKSMQTTFEALQRALIKYSPLFQDVEFTGFSVSNTIGTHINRALTESPKNHIIISPWNVMQEVQERVSQGITPNTSEGIINDFSEQTVAALVHEMMHTVRMSHDVKYVGHLTRAIGYLTDHLAELKQTMKGNLNESIVKIIQQHNEALRKDFGQK